MKYPAISDFSDCRSYFQEFYILNKTSGGPLSYRFLAKKLKWPVSYLSEIIQGRRSLTVARALEFARFAKFDVVDTERLIYLALSDLNDEPVKKYFLEKLELEYNSNSYSRQPEKNYASLKDDFPTTIDELKGDVAAGALLKLLVRNKGKIRKTQIQELMFSFPELMDSQALNQKLANLERNGNIKILSKKASPYLEVEILYPEIQFLVNKENIRDLAAFADNLSRVLKHPKAAGLFQFGFISIRKSRFLEVHKRLSTIRNWMMELEKEDQKITKKDPNDSILFQYDLSICAAIDFRSLGFKSLVD